MSTRGLRIAGVPEAYNDPFHTADFDKYGLVKRPTFIEYPGGSGSMLKAVISQEVDAAFALTDCIVAAIENGAPVRIAAPLVTTPLTWGVIVAPEGVASIDDLSRAKWGVSRIGSGSHVMVQTLAKNRGWTEAPQFEVCGNFQGLRGAVADGRIDAFLWEHYTTKPYADAGEVKIIGGVPTPWGCFCVVARSDCNQIDDIRKMVDAFTDSGKKFLDDDASVISVSRKYSMKEGDARAWISGVKYAQVGERRVSAKVLELTRNTLRDAGVIDRFTFQNGVEGYHL